ncbi:class I SAM-dependent methyltransferase [soil metagenome]
MAPIKLFCTFWLIAVFWVTFSIEDAFAQRPTPQIDVREAIPLNGLELPSLPQHEQRSETYRFGTASPDGTGKFYMGREIARVMSHRSAAWLERDERERIEHPDELVEALGLQPSNIVADIGAGTGYLTFRLAARVPLGWVLAVDIQEEMLFLLMDRAAASQIENVIPVLGDIDDPQLPESSVDLVLLVDTYHELSHPREMMEALFAGARAGGRVGVVEYRAEDPAVPIRRRHKMTEAQIIREIESVGFRHTVTLDVLPVQHLVMFERPIE